VYQLCVKTSVYLAKNILAILTDCALISWQ